MKLSFTVRSIPVAWSRTRIAWNPTTGAPRPFNKPQMTDYGHLVATAAALAAREQGWRMVPQGVPVTLTVTAYLPIQASTSKRTALAMVGAPGRGKPDVG